MKDIDTLLAVVAGGIYRRTIVLRSTLYSPIPIGSDNAYNSAAIDISVMHITQVPVYISDAGTNDVVIDVVKTLATKPEGTDLANNSATLAIAVSKVMRNSSPVDIGLNMASIDVIQFNVVRGYADDAASNSATLGVVKL